MWVIVRPKGRGFKAKDLAHSSPRLKALGYSGQFNKIKRSSNGNSGL